MATELVELITGAVLDDRGPGCSVVVIRRSPTGPPTGWALPNRGTAFSGLIAGSGVMVNPLREIIRLPFGPAELQSSHWRGTPARLPVRPCGCPAVVFEQGVLGVGSLAVVQEREPAARAG